MTTLTDEQIEEVVGRIIKMRRSWQDTRRVETDVNYLKYNGIELEFTEEGVLWKRKNPSS